MQWVLTIVIGIPAVTDAVWVAAIPAIAVREAAATGNIASMLIHRDTGQQRRPAVRGQST